MCAGRAAPEPPVLAAPLDTAAVDLLVVHHTVCDLDGRTVDEFVLDLDTSVRRLRNMAGIPYHWLIFADGTVRPGRPLDQRGEHASGYNSRSYGYAFVGNMSAVMPTKIATAVLVERLAMDAFDLGLDVQAVRGHGELEGVTKDCPGRYVCMSLVRALVARGLKRLAGHDLVTGQ
jgi:N-acetylmuramoyl-L-alanine amidase